MSFNVRFRWVAIALCGLGSTALVMHAQQEAGKVLVIQREFTKPGKEGKHEQTEAAYVAAARAGKSPDHYIAVTSLTGTPRALFMSSYSSFDDWAKTRMSMSSALMSTLDKVNQPDADLLTESGVSVWRRRDDLSLNTRGMEPGTRSLEMMQFVVKPGHALEWDELVKTVIAGYKKGVPDAHFTMYELAYGTLPGSAYLVISSHKLPSEIDSDYAKDPQFIEALGEAGLKKLESLESSSVETRMSNIFLVNPKMSYPPQAMVDPDPDFWKVTPPAKKAAPVKKPE